MAQSLEKAGQAGESAEQIHQPFAFHLRSACEVTWDGRNGAVAQVLGPWCKKPSRPRLGHVPAVAGGTKAWEAEGAEACRYT